jgi:hypothetical protein
MSSAVDFSLNTAFAGADTEKDMTGDPARVPHTRKAGFPFFALFLGAQHLASQRAPQIPSSANLHFGALPAGKTR